MNTVDLMAIKPCRCGGIAEARAGWSFWVECIECGEQTEGFSVLEDAILEWNESRCVDGSVSRRQAIQALNEVIPEHLRASRHGSGFLGERYELLRKFIEQAKEPA